MRTTAWRLALILSLALAMPLLDQLGRAQAPLTYEDIVSLVQKYDVRSIEGFMEMLSTKPEADGLLSNFTLIKIPQGDQQGSPKYPRAIMFDGELMVTFTGDPLARGNDNLDMIQLRPSGQPEFRRITFPSPKNDLQTAQFSEANPKVCFGCHHGRWIWGFYQEWKETYGHLDDAMFSKSEIPNRRGGPSITDDGWSLLFRDYQLTTAKTGPYRFLRPPTGSEYSPYGVEVFGPVLYRPNYRLGLSIARMNARRVFKRAQSHPLYKVWRILWYADFIDASLDFLPRPELLKAIHALGLRKEDTVFVRPTSFGQLPEHRISMLRAVDVLPADLSMDMLPPLFVSHPQDYNPKGRTNYFDGSNEGDFHLRFSEWIRKDISADVPEFRELSQLYYEALMSGKSDEQAPAIREILKKELLKEIEKICEKNLTPAA